ncbi:hypothetical protein [Cellulomonas sp. URHD0024]|uniref:hypothetical protein n=1 Tax=Cellulomonas sp. URHD0024 TaxID=1302620 RepID=UPI00040B7C31|nr:hypothetical protein [Cellulomonas sp. URHD0024]
MTDWQAVRDVYGSAADIPALLRDAASTNDWDARAWQELWGRLYHQGSVAPASYVALPALAEIAASRADVALDPALFLAAAIISSNDGPPEIDGVRGRYAAELALLRPVAARKLALVSDRGDVLWALQVVAALEDLSPWQRHLEGLAGEELELECPLCDDHIFLEFLGGTLVATADPDAAGRGVPVQAAASDGLDSGEARLLTLCQEYGKAAVAGELLQLFGRASCPYCRASFSIARAWA